MSDSSPAARLILRFVILAIVIWGLYLTIGAVLLRPARAAVLGGCFAGFLGFWWIMFKMRTRRVAREQQEKQELESGELSNGE